MLSTASLVILTWFAPEGHSQQDLVPSGSMAPEEERETSAPLHPIVETYLATSLLATSQLPAAQRQRFVETNVRRRNIGIELSCAAVVGMLERRGILNAKGSC